MSLTDPQLEAVLEKINRSEYKVAVGFSNNNLPLTAVKQNNTIIELLLSLHKKLDIFLSKEKNTNLESAIDDLSNRVKNLSISPEDKNVVRATSRGIYVWKDPKELLEEYKRAHGSKQQ